MSYMMWYNSSARSLYPQRLDWEQYSRLFKQNDPNKVFLFFFRFLVRSFSFIFSWCKVFSLWHQSLLHDQTGPFGKSYLDYDFVFPSLSDPGFNRKCSGDVLHTSRTSSDTTEGAASHSQLSKIIQKKKFFTHCFHQNQTERRWSWERSNQHPNNERVTCTRVRMTERVFVEQLMFWWGIL